MDPTRLALLRTVCESPEDDAPRLVFADWLDENGEPERAEFVRVQCEIARLNPGPTEHRKAANMLARYRKGAPVPLKAKTPAVLLLRESLLLSDSRSGLDWLAADFPRACTYRWFRGFISALTLSAANWLAVADALTWREGATMECGKCHGTGDRGIWGGVWPPCLTCAGTGRIPRPCPPTIQPIVSVNLTTAMDDDNCIRHGATVLVLPGDRPLWTFTSWPGIKFTMPQYGLDPASGADWTALGTVSGAVMVRPAVAAAREAAEKILPGCH